MSLNIDTESDSVLILLPTNQSLSKLMIDISYYFIPLRVLTATESLIVSENPFLTRPL